MASSERRRDEKRPGLVKRAAREASWRVFELVDPDVVLDHVDVNALLDRVDVNTLLDRVDVNTLMDRVDVKAIVERAGIPEIVAESTGHLGGSALDLARRPLVGLDEIFLRVANGVFRRDISRYPEGPGQLVEWAEERVEVKEASRTGRYAGPLTRLLAVGLDGLIVTAGFTLIIAGATFLIGLLVQGDVQVPRTGGFWFGIGFASWAFLYLWISLSVFGKTIGKAVLGVRVVGSDGTMALHGRQALIRTLTYPLSFALLGVGLLGVVFGSERRAWHDRFAGTAVVYDWGSRTAQMPTPLAEFLARRNVPRAGQDLEEEE